MSALCVGPWRDFCVCECLSTLPKFSAERVAPIATGATLTAPVRAHAVDHSRWRPRSPSQQSLRATYLAPARVCSEALFHARASNSDSARAAAQGERAAAAQPWMQMRQPRRHRHHLSCLSLLQRPPAMHAISQGKAARAHTQLVFRIMQRMRSIWNVINHDS